MKLSIKLIILFFLSSFLLQGNQVYQNFDMQGYIESQLKKGNIEITIPPGTYYVKPKNKAHLRLENKEGITINATGVEMICTTQTRAIDLVKCKNVKIIGLSIDYDPIPFTQGVITKISEDKNWFDVRILDGYPKQSFSKHRVEVFDKKSQKLKAKTYFLVTYEQQSNGETRVFKRATERYTPAINTEDVGDYVVLPVEKPKGILTHTIFLDHCSNVQLEEITVYASPVFSFFEVYGNANKYLNCKVIPKPLTSDHTKRELRRLRSGNADAFHSKFASNGPTYDGCIAYNQADDCVNICGAYHLLLENKSKVLRLAVKANLDIQEGDQLECILPSGEVNRNLKVTKIIASGEPSDIDQLYIDSLKLTRVKKQLRKVYELHIDKAVKFPMGTVVGSRNRMGNNFIVQNGKFGRNRSRGILIKSSHGKVVNNIIENCWGEAIKVAPEVKWLESGISTDLIISGNRIINSRSMGIAIYAVSIDGKLMPQHVHQNIRITNNRIEKTKGPGLLVTSTKGLLLEKNQIQYSKKMVPCKFYNTNIQVQSGTAKIFTTQDK
ncbi:MAG: right-handed parallel beta-helix repeat-containing protein [Lentisphaeria bacterium]|nr:right-handed parallel beta-helix repeat-containing protein [Lentisphaeria bacterium]